MEDLATKMDAEVRVHEVVNDYQGVPQGDVTLVKLPNLKEGRKKLEKMLAKNWPGFKFGPVGPITQNHQLVSDNTMGARHCISEADRSVVTVHARSEKAHALEGPVIVASSRFGYVHPEHADHELPEGCYQAIYQLDWAAEKMARIQD